jgi:hypothetical protein
VTEKTLEELAQDVLDGFNVDDVKVTVDADGGLLIDVDDETETYKKLVAIGRNITPGLGEKEAFELALTVILSEHETN